MQSVFDIDSGLFESQDSFYNQLEDIFDRIIYPTMFQEFPESWNTEPLYYYFRIVEIRKFRSALPVLFAHYEQLNLKSLSAIGLAAELIFCASLILDDIIDDDDIRSNDEASHIKYGVERTISSAYLAISTADMIMSKSFHENGIDAKRANQVRDIFSKSNIGLMNSFLKERESIGVLLDKQGYIQLLKNKTITGTAALSSVGVFCETDISNELWNIGNLLGVAGQIKNDIYDFTILAEARDGNFSDLENSYYTYPVLKLREVKGLTEKEVVKLINSTTKTDIPDLLTKEDILEACRDDINNHVEKAITEIGKLPLRNDTKRLLVFWAECNKLSSPNEGRTGRKKSN